MRFEPDERNRDADDHDWCRAQAAPTARANQLTMVIVHGTEHYGNLVTYMRIKGIVPPSSSPQ